jgi:hypothetical protein
MHNCGSYQDLKIITEEKNPQGLVRDTDLSVSEYEAQKLFMKVFPAGLLIISLRIPAS